VKRAITPGMSTYKGDSAGKKLARYFEHQQGRAQIGEERFRSGRHLVLAGHGGDVACLLALGARNITAVSIEQDDVDLVRQRFPQDRFPGVDVRLEDVGNAAVRAWYDTLSLDFCGVIDGPKAMLLRRICLAQTYGRSDRVYMTVLFQNGRDHRPSGLVPERGSFLDSERFLMSEQLASATEWFRHKHEQLSSFAEWSIAWRKVAMLGRLLLPVSRKLNKAPIYAAFPQGIATYHSGTPHGGGVQMMAGSFELASESELTARYKAGAEFIASRFWWADIGGHKRAYPVLRQLAHELRSQPAETVAGLFDLDPRQVVAWRAVGTREQRAKQRAFGKALELAGAAE
jgi:hypothetical protein